MCRFCVLEWCCLRADFRVIVTGWLRCLVSFLRCCLRVPVSLRGFLSFFNVICGADLCVLGGVMFLLVGFRVVVLNV